MNRNIPEVNELLHIHCGDASADTMRTALIPGDILVWREIYLEGPVAGNVTDSDFRKSRALFLSSFGFPYYEILEAVEIMYRRLGEAGKYREIVLWFDACMFDQTILIHVLDRLAKHKFIGTTVSLVAVTGRGLGEFSSSEMLALFDGRRRVSSLEYKIASDAWQAFCSDAPRDIEDFLKNEFFGLPSLKAALRRHLKQFPSTANGLNMLQQNALTAVNIGVNSLLELFKQVSAMEQERFLGDTSFWTCLDEMAECACPALKVEGPGRLKRPMTDPLINLDRWQVNITRFGKALLEGRENWIAHNGIDRWLGGVHLLGKTMIWQYDATNDCMVRNNPAEATA